MAVAGYAIGAARGIVYLRAEYRYLERYLEKVLEEMRARGLLGSNIAGKDGFDFDIRIQFGAGAYVCGEESALLESAEGKRGEPRDRHGLRMAPATALAFIQGRAHTEPHAGPPAWAPGGLACEAHVCNRRDETAPARRADRARNSRREGVT
jgi:hypothetical protein